jgi:hypothetical protein
LCSAAAASTLARLALLRRGRGPRADRRHLRGRRDRRRAEADRLDQRDELADRRPEVADVALGEHPSTGRDDEQAAERGVTLIQRQADDRADQRGALDERRHVAVLRRAVDEVRAPVEEAVQRHVPAGDVPAAHAAEAAAALVGEVALGGEPQELLPLVEEADGAPRAAGRLDDPAQRRLERVLRRRRLADDRLQALGGLVGLVRRRRGPRPSGGGTRGVRFLRAEQSHPAAFCNGCAAALSGT